MALNNSLQNGLQTDVDIIRGRGEPESKFEVGEEVDLESEVKQMTKKILEYRVALPDQLMSTLASLLSAQRPVMPEIDSWTEPEPSGEAKSGKAALPAEDDQRTAEKVSLLNDKVSSNASAMSTVLKRVRECISTIDKPDSHNERIHAVFKKKKIS